MSNTRPSILLAASKWWPLSARLAVALHRHDCEVSALCPAKHPLTHVTGIRRFYRYGGLFSITSLRRALHQCQPDIVVPCDDGVVAQLHALHALDPSLRTLIERSLGPAESYPILENRYRFLTIATELGIAAPRTQRVDQAEDLVRWHKEISPAGVLKVDGESGGNGVRISHSLVDSLAAWQELRMARNAATAWKRLAIDRDPLALWLRGRQFSREVTVQEFISGRPANAMLLCWRGELKSMISVVVVAAEGATGAATIVRVIQSEQMTKTAKLVASRLNLSGFYGLDFVIQADTGIPYLIEINPRCTQLGHIEFAGDGCIAGVLSSVLYGESRPVACNPIPKQKIALFPQALSAGDACRPYIDKSYHDVPSEEPRLRDELMLKSWPQRQWTARLYHAFKPLNRATPALFEGIDDASLLVR